VVYIRPEHISVEIHTPVRNSLEEKFQIKSFVGNAGINGIAYFRMTMSSYGDFIIYIYDAVIVLIFVFKIARTNDRESLCRTRNNVAFILKEPNGFQSIVLVNRFVFAGTVFLFPRCFVIFYDPAAGERKMTAQVVVEF